MMQPNIREELEKKLGQSLQTHGFAKMRKQWYVKPLSDDVTGMVTFNLLSHKPSVTLDPFVSVNSAQLEKRLSEFANQKYKPLSTMSLCESVKTFLPEVPLEMYEFDCQEDLVRVETLTAQIVSATSHFLSGNDSLESICESFLRIGGGHSYFTRVKVPVALWLLGRTEEAQEFLKDDKIRQEVEYGPLDENLLQFYARFEAAMSRGGPSI